MIDFTPAEGWRVRRGHSFILLVDDVRGTHVWVYEATAFACTSAGTRGPIEGLRREALLLMTPGEVEAWVERGES